MLLTRGIHRSALRDLRGEFSLRIHSGEIPMPRGELISKIRDADGLICFPYDRIDGEVMDAGPRLRAISTYSVGFDHIDIQHAKRRGIRVGYTPGVLTDATADLAMALMLDVMRRVSEGDRIIRGGGWKQIYGAYDYVGRDLGGKTLGILGMGRIGEAVARRASAFGMRIAYHSRTRLPRTREAGLKARFVGLDGLIAGSDVLSLHVPHTAETDSMINLAALRRMKRTAFLINTARGRIVDEGGLVTALRGRMIAGAGLDVFRSEPVGAGHPLIGMDNVVLAPHIGSSTAETRERMSEITVENLRLGISGRKPAHSVGY